MSTGVFRQYPPPKLPAPKFTAGQPLDAPIGAQPVQGAYSRSSSVTRLIPLGVAALIPVAAGFVPPPAMAAVPRAPAQQPQQPPEPIAPFLSQVGPSSPPTLTPVALVTRGPYPVQELSPGIAPLIPAPTSYVAPASVPAVSRTQYSAQQPPEFIAPFLSSNTTDTPIPWSQPSMPPRPSYPIQEPNVGIAALIPVAAQAYVPPAVLQAVRSDSARPQLSVPGIAPLLPIQVEYVPPARVPAVTVGTWQVQYFRVRSDIAALLATPDFIPRGNQTTLRVFENPWRAAAYNLSRPLQIQDGPPVVIPESIDSTRMLRVTFNGRTIYVASPKRTIN